MIEFDNVLYVRRTEDAMYIRYKEQKEEHLIPFTKVLTDDKNQEFMALCDKIENNNEIEYEKAVMWKYIVKDDKNKTPAEKVYFNKYNKVYSNGHICIYKTGVDGKWCIWNRQKPFSTGSCVVKSTNYPGHIAAILEARRIPDAPNNKNLLSALIILTTDNRYKRRLNNVWHNIFNE